MAINSPPDVRERHKLPYTQRYNTDIQSRRYFVLRLFGLVSVPRNSIINCRSARTIDEQIEKYLKRTEL